MQRKQIKSSRFRFFAVLAGGITVVLAGITIPLCCRTHELQLSGYSVVPYDDRNEQATPGASEVLGVHADSTAISLQYILREGFGYPYAGILLDFSNGRNHHLDGTRYHAIKLRIASSQFSDCKIYLMTFDKNGAQMNLPLRERYLQHNLMLNPVPKTFTIPLGQFATPEWWFQKNNITLKDVAPVDLSKITALKIESGPTARTGTIDTLTISGIAVTTTPGMFIRMALALLAAITGVCAVLSITPGKKKNPVIITYDKKEIRSYRDMDAQRISDYLAKRFSDPAASIGTMGASLGFSQKKIAKVMNSEFGMSFKQYLTSIRIHEAKRLLLETDRLVIDIALEVGFNNVSHFNRVFKNATEVSPMEFRGRGVVG